MSLGQLDTTAYGANYVIDRQGVIVVSAYKSDGGRDWTELYIVRDGKSTLVCADFARDHMLKFIRNDHLIVCVLRVDLGRDRGTANSARYDVPVSVYSYPIEVYQDGDLVVTADVTFAYPPASTVHYRCACVHDGSTTVLKNPYMSSLALEYSDGVYRVAERQIAGIYVQGAYKIVEYCDDYLRSTYECQIYRNQKLEYTLTGTGYVDSVVDYILRIYDAESRAIAVYILP